MIYRQSGLDVVVVLGYYVVGIEPMHCKHKYMSNYLVVNYEIIYSVTCLPDA